MKQVINNKNLPIYLFNLCIENPTDKDFYNFSIIRFMDMLMPDKGCFFENGKFNYGNGIRVYLKGEKGDIRNLISEVIASPIKLSSFYLSFDNPLSFYPSLIETRVKCGESLPPANYLSIEKVVDCLPGGKDKIFHCYAEIDIHINTELIINVLPKQNITSIFTYCHSK